ncbi:Rha family transcriptional regulator [Marinobacter sp. MA]|uniref:Rha family transcriptional regulator n=1 Tax=Marinobacter sp. MA TaxID=2971606 RepID=UPI003AAC736F|nr:Rha family transcriptional regulator [Marinobacter adhaerens]
MADLILSGNNTPTMSSREIAELTGSRHDNVKRSAERLAADHILTSPLEGSDYEHRGNIYQEYRFNKRDSLVLVARLSPEFTAAVVDRWQFLEEQAALPSWARNLTKEARIALEDLSSQVDHYKGETNRLNAVCNDLAENLKSGLTPVEFCRMLNGVNLNRVQPVLVERKRLLRTPHGYRSAAAYRDKLFTERRYLNRDDRPCEKVVLTQKGAKWLYAQYEQGRLEMRKDWDGHYSHVLFDDQENVA